MKTERRFLTCYSSVILILVDPSTPFPAPLACTVWLLHAFEDFAFLWHLIPCSPWPGSQLLQNICPKLPYQNNTAFSRATVNTTCSQKYNPYHFSFPKTVGEFLQHLNPLVIFFYFYLARRTEKDGREAEKIQNQNIWIKTCIKNTSYSQSRSWIDNFIKYLTTWSSPGIFFFSSPLFCMIVSLPPKTNFPIYSWVFIFPKLLTLTLS